MDKNITPKVSVVMSVYNGEKYLREAIDSVLNQAFTDFEFVIINDGSTDNSQAIIESYTDDRIIIINQENKGLAYSLNKGIDASKAEMIARMDADDVSETNRLKKQYAFLIANPAYIIVGTNAKVIDEHGSYVYSEHKKESDEEIRKIFPYTPFIHPSVMFRKDAFLKAGKYCMRILKSQDRVLFNRMAKYGKMANIQEYLLQYRIVPFSVTQRGGQNIKTYDRIINEAIEANNLSDDSFKLQQNLINSVSKNTKHYNYHIYLAKRYLLNRHNRKKALQHCIQALGYKVTKRLLLLFTLSLLPKKIINIYQKKE